MKKGFKKIGKYKHLDIWYDPNFVCNYFHYFRIYSNNKPHGFEMPLIRSNNNHFEPFVLPFKRIAGIGTTINLKIFKRKFETFKYIASPIKNIDKILEILKNLHEK